VNDPQWPLWVFRDVSYDEPTRLGVRAIDTAAIEFPGVPPQAASRHRLVFHRFPGFDRLYHLPCSTDFSMGRGRNGELAISSFVLTRYAGEWLFRPVVASPPGSGHVPIAVFERAFSVIVAHHEQHNNPLWVPSSNRA
jgi:hypothetical protein